MKHAICSGLLAVLVWAALPAGARPRQAEGTRTVESALPPPPGYQRIAVMPGSFAAWLRARPLKPAGTPVRLYDGRIKPERGVYAAVLDLDIGTSDLQQCADAVIRLRAEYLFSKAAYGSIAFHFTNGFLADYRHWRDGYRITVNAGGARWIKRAAPDAGYAQFRRYLETVFSYAGTHSLERELEPVAFSAMRPGDVLIQGGSPGHAVLVMDMAVNARGQKCYLLSQSYMPAQDIQVLREPGGQLDGVWYLLQTERAVVPTPEWEFSTTQLRRFTGLP